jgi:very-short-patch-repair endonuclease
LVDLAATLSAGQIRRALAEADFRGLLDPVDARGAMKSGRPGSKALRAALRRHMPELAETFSVLEERFLELCERAHLRIPEMNARVGRMRVDALWREERIAVELDGAAAHRGYAVIRRDRRREVALRAAGFQVVRYGWDLVAKSPEEVVLDLRRLLIL